MNWFNHTRSFWPWGYLVEINLLWCSWSNSCSREHIIGHRWDQVKARFEGTEGRKGSMFRRNDNGLRIISGMNRRWCISRQLIAWFLESSCVDCLGHGRGLPPGSQPNLQRIQRLRSDLDMSNQSIGSREIDRRQLESSLEPQHRWRISWFWCKRRRLATICFCINRQNYYWKKSVAWKAYYHIRSRVGDNHDWDKYASQPTLSIIS